MCKPFVWSHLGLNQGLPDYETEKLTFLLYVISYNIFSFAL